MQVGAFSNAGRYTYSSTVQVSWSTWSAFDNLPMRQNPRWLCRVV